MTAHTLTPDGLKVMLAENTGDVMLMTLKITHDDLTEDIRVVSNTEDITFESEVYQGVLFDAVLAADIEDQVPTASVKIDNVSQEMVAAVRSIQSPPEVEMNVIRVDTSGTVSRERGPFAFRLTDTSWDALIIEGSLGYEADYLNEAAQADHYDPTIFPGLFT